MHEMHNGSVTAITLVCVTFSSYVGPDSATGLLTSFHLTEPPPPQSTAWPVSQTQRNINVQKVVQKLHINPYDYGRQEFSDIIL